MKSTASAVAVPTGSASAACLPILRHTRTQLAALASKRATSISHLTALVESDPALTLNLFAAVNPHLARVGRPAAEQIQHAVLVLGVPAFLAQCDGFASIDDGAPEPRIAIDILARGCHAAQQAQVFAEFLPDANPRAVLAATLSLYGLEYARTVPAARGAVEAFESALPPLAGTRDNGDSGYRCVTLGTRFADAVAEAWDNDALAPLYAELGELMKQDAGDAERLVKLTTVSVARHYRHAGARPAAMNLLSPGPWPSAAAPPAGVADAQTGFAPDEEPAPAPPSQSEPDAGACALATLQQAVAGGRSGTTLLTLALAAACTYAGYRIAVVLLREGATGGFRLKLRDGAALPADYEDLALSAAANPLLRKLLRKERIVKIDPSRDRALLDELDPMLRRLIGRHEACAQSLAPGGKPLGIVLACRPGEPGGFEKFREVGRVLRAALRARGGRVANPASG